MPTLKTSEANLAEFKSVFGFLPQNPPSPIDVDRVQFWLIYLFRKLKAQKGNLLAALNSSAYTERQIRQLCEEEKAAYNAWYRARGAAEKMGFPIRPHRF